MKWVCKHCKAINPELSYKCHSCGKELNEVVYATSDSTEPTPVFRKFKCKDCPGELDAECCGFVKDPKSSVRRP